MLCELIVERVMTTMKIRTYSELKRLPTFSERFNYLNLQGTVGATTFGFDRHINQLLYKSDAWKWARDEVIIRDLGCDLGIEGYEIHGRIVVHHMNPITVEDVLNNDIKVFDPEFLIATTHNTHMAIHYGDESLLPKPLVKRRKNDTIPWK